MRPPIVGRVRVQEGGPISISEIVQDAIDCALVGAKNLFVRGVRGTRVKTAHMERDLSQSGLEFVSCVVEDVSTV